MNGGGVGPRACDATRRRRRAAAALLGAGLVVAFACPAVADPVSAENVGGEIRVRSGPGAISRVTIAAQPGVHVENRTPGGTPAAGGNAGSGETFAGDVTVFLSGYRVGRPATVDVADPVVSAVRVFPEKTGTAVVVFVRQPVGYTISQPSVSGEVLVELRGKARPVTVTTTPRGRQRVKRPEPVGEGEVSVDAESLSYDQQTNTLTARGGVTLTRGDTTLTADDVLYDRTNAVAQARGHVVVTDPEATITGSFAHLNLDDESGWVETADATLQPTGYSLLAGRIEKQGGPRYSVANGVFTTCRCGGLERPSWSIAARQTDVQLQVRGVARGATFRLKDVPVLYFPYFVFPAATERQTGFLMPRLGYSNRRGFQYEQPFFWAISKSSDATLGLDVETAARIGVVGEYRYVLSRMIRGEFAAAYYNEEVRGRTLGTTTNDVNPDIPQNRFLLAGRHSQPLSDDSKLYLDLFAVSDDDFLREINTFSFIGWQDVTLRSVRLTTSRAEVVKTWRGGVAEVDTTYHQDLIDPQAVTLQRLPNLLAEHSQPLLGDRVVARLAGEATDFWREDGFDGLRADLAPEVLVPFHLGNVLSGSLTGQVRETAYHLFNQEQVVEVVPDAGVTRAADFEKFRTYPGLLPQLEKNRTRELASVHGRVGTTLQRVFDFPHLGLGKVMHTVEPEVQYLFVPQSGRPFDTVVLPACSVLAARGETPQAGVNCDATLFGEGFLFDERDAINRRNFLSYGLTTRLLGRAPQPAAPPAAGAEPVVGPPAPPAGPPPVPVTPPRELARATILHGYDISRTLVGKSHQSDVDLGLRLTPTDYLSVNYNTTVNFEQGKERGRTIGLLLREPGWTVPADSRKLQSPTAVGVSYHFVEKNVNTDLGVKPPESLLFQANGVDEIDGGVYLRLGQYLGFTFLSRYTLDTTPVVQPGGQIENLGPHFLERDYLVRLISRCDCWAIDVGLADKFNPDERLFRIQFTLVGLGSIGQGGRHLNYVGVGPLAQTGVRRGPSPAGGAFY